MFSVACVGSDSSNKKLVAQGLSLGDHGHSVVFNITTPLIEIPLVVKFSIEESSEYEAATVLVGNIVDNSVDVKFFNAPSSGKSGIFEPVSIVAVGDVELLMMFYVDRNPKAPVFTLYYAFYEVKSMKGPQN